MAKKMRKRVYRKATAEERKKHQQIRQQIESDLPEIKKRAKRKLAKAVRRGLDIQNTLAALKAERIKKGLSLADIKERSGIQRSTLSRLENNAEANPTIGTLTRYADAVGKEVRVILADADTAE